MFLHRCPRQLIGPEVLELWDIFQSFKCLGCLPFTGGFYEQDNLTLDAIKFCESLSNTTIEDPAFTKYLREKKKKTEKTDPSTDSKYNNLGDMMNRRKRIKDGVK